MKFHGFVRFNLSFPFLNVVVTCVVHQKPFDEEFYVNKPGTLNSISSVSVHILHLFFFLLLEKLSPTGLRNQVKCLLKFTNGQRCALSKLYMIGKNACTEILYQSHK